MSKTEPKSKPKPESTHGRRPVQVHRRSLLRRAAPWLAAATVAVIAVVVVAARSNDGGDSGGSADPLFVGGDLHTLVVDPDQAGRLFVGGHQGVAASTDDGVTWSQVDSLRDADAMGWAFADGVVWMGGHPGMRRSTDGGLTFQPAGGELAGRDIHALGGGGGVLYAASPGAGLLASTDGGGSWEVRSADAGQGLMGGIVVDSADSRHLYAPDMRAGVVESVDGGRTWRPLGSPGMAMSAAAVGDTGALIVAGGGQAARSDDNGQTWQTLDVPRDTMVVAAGSEGRIYAASLDGSAAKVSVSVDGGSNWQPLGR